MSMYPNIESEAPAPSAPGFVIDDQHQNSPYDKQPPYAPSYQHQPPPPYSVGPNQQPQLQPTPIIIQQQPSSNATDTTVIIDKFPAKSISMRCFYCHQDIKTQTQGKSNLCTWLACAFLCFIGCSFGCCLIPFCTDCSRDMLHYCPNCKKYLGSHQRFG